MDRILDIFLFIFTVVIVLYYIYEKIVVKKRKFSDGKLAIPGLTKTHPSQGNLVELRKCGGIHQFLTYLHGNYGNIASFYWMDKEVVSICDHDSFKSVKHLFDRAGMVFENLKPFIGEECIQFANGVEARDRRKCYDRSFTHSALLKHVETMKEVGNEEIRRLDSSETLTIASTHDTGFIMAITTILRCCISPDRKDNEFIFKIINLYEKVLDGLTDRLINEKSLEPSDPEETEFQEAKKEFQSLVKEIVINRMKTLDTVERKKEGAFLIDDIIYFHGDVNVDVIIKDIIVYMIAGFHTSGNLFSWCLYYLAKHPHCQEKIFEEIVENQIMSTDAHEYFDGISQMPFLRATINETLRLSELASFGSRYSNEDISIGPHFIPANTPIILALGVSFNDPKVFKNPNVFDPSRFIDGNLPSLSFVPFGFAGKRKCPGESFSFLEVSIWLIQFIKKYKFLLLKPDEEVKKIYGIVTHMDRPVSVVFEHR